MRSNSAKYFLGIAGSCAACCGVVKPAAAQSGRPVAQAVYDSVGARAARPPLVLGAYAQGSFILSHTPAIRHLAASHPTGMELNA
ncbi:MAG: hypothetical protein EOO61_09015, partial [Hymenobacter sp.]